VQDSLQNSKEISLEEVLKDKTQEYIWKDKVKPGKRQVFKRAQKSIREH